MREIITLILISLTQITFCQEVIQLIGLDVDSSEFSKHSYSAMYDSENPKKIENYTPYKTLGVYRKGNSIEILTLDYLLIPTKHGFKYATLNVTETKLSKSHYKDYHYLPSDALDLYKLSKSMTKPIFFTTKLEINKFINTLQPSFKDALEIDFNRFSYVNPAFYTTVGFNSEVHGGASWFHSNEKVNIHPIDWNKGKISNNVLDYLSNFDKNQIIINTVKSMEDYGYGNYEVDENTLLPWSSSIIDYKNVYFDFHFQGNGIGIIPLTLLQGNSSRAFLAKGAIIENEKLYKTFNVQKCNNTNSVIILSPDKLTRTEIYKNNISIYDQPTNSLLKSISIKFNKIIMSEFATGKHIKKWKNEF